MAPSIKDLQNNLIGSSKIGNSRTTAGGSSLDAIINQIGKDNEKAKKVILKNTDSTAKSIVHAQNTLGNITVKAEASNKKFVVSLFGGVVKLTEDVALEHIKKLGGKRVAFSNELRKLNKAIEKTSDKDEKKALKQKLEIIKTRKSIADSEAKIYKTLNTEPEKYVKGSEAKVLGTKGQEVPVTIADELKNIERNKKKLSYLDVPEKGKESTLYSKKKDPFLSKKDFENAEKGFLKVGKQLDVVKTKLSVAIFNQNKPLIKKLIEEQTLLKAEERLTDLTIKLKEAIEAGDIEEINRLNMELSDTIDITLSLGSASDKVKGKLREMGKSIKARTIEFASIGAGAVSIWSGFRDLGEIVETYNERNIVLGDSLTEIAEAHGTLLSHLKSTVKAYAGAGAQTASLWSSSMKLGISYSELSGISDVLRGKINDSGLTAELTAIRLNKLTERAAVAAKVLGIDVSQSTDYVKNSLWKFGQTAKTAGEELFEFRKMAEETNATLGSGAILTDDFVQIMTDARSGTKKYAQDTRFLGSVVRMHIERVQRLGATYQESIDQAKQLAGLMTEETPPLINYQAGSQIMSDVQNQVNSIRKTIKGVGDLTREESELILTSYGKNFSSLSAKEKEQAMDRIANARAFYNEGADNLKQAYSIAEAQEGVANPLMRQKIIMEKMGETSAGMIMKARASIKFGKEQYMIMLMSQGVSEATAAQMYNSQIQIVKNAEETNKKAEELYNITSKDLQNQITKINERGDLNEKQKKESIEFSVYEADIRTKAIQEAKRTGRRDIVDRLSLLSITKKEYEKKLEDQGLTKKIIDERWVALQKEKKERTLMLEKNREMLAMSDKEYKQSIEQGRTEKEVNDLMKLRSEMIENVSKGALSGIDNLENRYRDQLAATKSTTTKFLENIQELISNNPLAKIAIGVGAAFSGVALMAAQVGLLKSSITHTGLLTKIAFGVNPKSGIFKSIFDKFKGGAKGGASAATGAAGELLSTGGKTAKKAGILSKAGSAVKGVGKLAIGAAGPLAAMAVAGAAGAAVGTAINDAISPSMNKFFTDRSDKKADSEFRAKLATLEAERKTQKERNLSSEVSSSLLREKDKSLKEKSITTMGGTSKTQTPIGTITNYTNSNNGTIIMEVRGLGPVMAQNEVLKGNSR